MRSDDEWIELSFEKRKSISTGRRMILTAKQDIGPFLCDVPLSMPA
jgi:hypothetical protein